MGRLFNMDNKFFIFMGRMADLLLLNILCVLCCIPVITAGASITAMYYVTLKMVRNEESYIVRSFFKSFKENFKQATIINIIMVLTAVFLYADFNIAKNMNSSMSKALMCVFTILTFFYAMILLYIYPLLAKFYNSIKNTFVNAFLMALRHLPYTMLMLVIAVLPIAIFFIPTPTIQSFLLLFLIMIGPAAIAYVQSCFFVKVFDNYIPKEEDEPNPDSVVVSENDNVTP